MPLYRDDVTHGQILHLEKAKSHRILIMFTRLGQLCKLTDDDENELKWPMSFGKVAYLYLELVAKLNFGRAATSTSFNFAVSS